MNTFIVEIGKHVLPLSKEHKINPELIIAIALTSESCTKEGNPTELYTKCFNAFAARGNYNGNSINVTFNEAKNPIPCKVYESAEESVKDFFNMILTRKTKKSNNLKFAKIIGVEDYKEACKNFAEVGYCTWIGKEYEEALIAAIEAFLPNGLEAILNPPIVPEMKAIKEDNFSNINTPKETKEVTKSNIDNNVIEEVEPKPKNRLRKAFTPYKAKEIRIKNAPVYVSAWDENPYTHLSGTFYIANGAVYNNRVHIVKEKGHIDAGLKLILGLVDIEDIEK